MAFFVLPFRIVACVGDLGISEFVALGFQEQTGLVDTPDLHVSSDEKSLR
jgi:hypothetical protein